MDTDPTPKLMVMDLLFSSEFRNVNKTENDRENGELCSVTIDLERETVRGVGKRERRWTDEN